MNTSKNFSERGQAVVLVMVAIVVLLGFTALAVDGSMIYSDRRFAQSGADASSLAGGGMAAQWMGKKGVINANFGESAGKCTGDTLIAANKGLEAAVTRAADNDFKVVKSESGENRVWATCGKDPITAPKAGGGEFTLGYDTFMDVHNTITSQTKTAFMHFVFSGVAKNTVMSVTRIRPPQPLAFGFAIVSLNPSPCNGKDGLIFSGNSATPVFGGGAYSNGCMSTNGGGSLDLTDGSAAYFDTNKPGGISVLTDGYERAQLANNAPRLPANTYDVPVPNCTESNTHPGSWLDNKTSLTGLVCIKGDAVIHGKVAGTSVTIVFLGGKLTMNAGSDINISAPTAGYKGDALAGVALYFPSQYYGPKCGEVNQEIKINGSSNSGVTGSILAPCSDISLEGGADTLAYHSQVIGWNVNVGGGGDLEIWYDADDNYLRPTYLDLYR